MHVGDQDDRITVKEIEETLTELANFQSIVLSSTWHNWIVIITRICCYLIGAADQDKTNEARMERELLRLANLEKLIKFCELPDAYCK